MLEFFAVYYRNLEDENISDNFFDKLYLKYQVSESDHTRFNYGISIRMNNGIFVKPYIIDVQNSKIEWRDSGKLEIIKFYRVNEAYGYLSNFSRHSFKCDGITWPTVEHYYQSAKFNFSNPNILNVKTPFEAAQIGRDKNNKIRNDWDDIKFYIMTKALLAKFDQNLEIRKMLIETYPNQLIEHTSNDIYWADGGNAEGLNMLGVVLMNTRDYLTYKYNM